MDWLDDIKWDGDGLVPVMAQELGSGDGLMFAWVNRQAPAATGDRRQAGVGAAQDGRDYLQAGDAGAAQHAPLNGLHQRFLVGGRVSDQGAFAEID